MKLHLRASNNRGDFITKTTIGHLHQVWTLCWCPLLQGIARVCCDPRKDVRMAGLTYLQRALLAHDLRALPAVEWEACFRQVIFPLLAR